MNNQKGFTLIEMLVVIAIVGLLSSVVVVGLGGAREKARDARRIADIRQIQNALEVAYTNASGYPSVTDDGGPPGDLEDSQGNPYKYSTTGFSYKLGISLEGGTNDNFDDGNCPSAITSADAFCVSPN